MLLREREQSRIELKKGKYYEKIKIFVVCNGVISKQL